MKAKIKIALLLWFIFFPITVYSQSNSEKIIINEEYNNKTLEEVLKDIEKKYKIGFSYIDQNIEGIRITVTINRKTLPDALNIILAGTNLSFKINNNKVIIIYYNPNKNIKKNSNDKIKKKTICGYIEDIETGERLIGANIYVDSTFIGTCSNNYGFYSITHPEQTISLNYSYIGYQTEKINIFLNRDTFTNVSLNPSIELNEVVIKSVKRNSVIDNTNISTNKLPIRKINTLPVVLGEIDIIKSLQLLPGITSGIEGSSNIYVRGGGPDQNLIFLDGVPLYNLNHIFGFFSVFNEDAINDVKIIKGGFPARYGGRLSSVLDIRMKEGNIKKFHGKATIGLVSSKLTLEGPIKKDKSSFIISGRRTYIDLFLRPIQELGMSYYFYDLNTKFNYKFSNKSRLYFSTYLGADKGYYEWNTGYDGWNTGYDEKLELGCRNMIAALRWNYIFSPNLFSNTTITYSNYNFFTGFGFKDLYTVNNINYSDEYLQELFSGINDWAAKIDFIFIPSSNHYIRYGINNTIHTFNPNIRVYHYKEGNSNIDTSYNNKKIYANEVFLYAEDEIKIINKLKLNVGFHYSNFYVMNKLYQSIQPRISMQYLNSEKLSFNASYTCMTQYIHLLANNSTALPTDLWVPTTKNIYPQNSVQYTIGSVYSIINKLNISIEAYYKSMQNLIEYKEGATYFRESENLEDRIESGKGWAYGFEILLEKSYGKTSGWIGYTLSWSDRQFENISLGKVFPYTYDKRHNVSIVLTHKFTNNFDLGLLWVYTTGRAISVGTEKYMDNLQFFQEINEIYDEVNKHTLVFKNRNNYRLPDYHRLDAGLNFYKEKKRGERIWRVGAYNIYNRKNTFIVYQYDQEIEKLSLFTIFPYVRYIFSF